MQEYMWIDVDPLQKKLLGILGYCTIAYIFFAALIMSGVLGPSASSLFLAVMIPLFFGMMGVAILLWAAQFFYVMKKSPGKNPGDDEADKSRNR